MNTRQVTNWTSTQVPLWETDCLQFWRAGQPFELRDVTSEEHSKFVADFAKTRNLEAQRNGDRVIFRPRLDATASD